MLENQKPFFTFIHRSARLHFIFLHSRQRHRCQNFQYFEKYFEIFWNKVPYRLALHLVEMDTDPDPAPDPDWQALYADPDPPKWCRPERIHIHNTVHTYGVSSFPF
jgi:hypothetical protein